MKNFKSKQGWVKELANLKKRSDYRTQKLQRKKKRPISLGKLGQACGSVVEHLPCICEDLSTTKKNGT